MKTVKLGVNIDHVATIRQTRGEDYPSLVSAAKTCLLHGADQITIHLREDRRHIQDPDVESVKLVTREFNKPLNLEMGCNEDIINIAIASKPDWICLVPEKREERTTEGGLDLIGANQFQKVSSTIEILKKSLPLTKISLFVEAKEEIMRRSIDLGVDAVEIHTGEYAKAFNQDEDIEVFLSQFKKCYELIQKSSLRYHAGHGLTFKNTKPLLKLNLFSEYNIGHWIVAEALFKGLGVVVRDFKGLIDENS